MKKKIEFTNSAWKFYTEQSEKVKTQKTPKAEIEKAVSIRKAAGV